MKSMQMSGRSKVGPATSQGRGERWSLSLNRQQKIIAVGDQGPFASQDLAVYIGRRLEQVEALRHFHALLVKGFCFRALPVQLDEHWYLAEYLPREAGGTLVLDALAEGGEAAMALHDFVQAIDPFSLEAAGGILLVDRAGVILMVNGDFADILGLQAVDMLGRHVNDSYPVATLSRLPKVMASGKAEIGEAHRLNGRQIVASRWPLIRNGTVYGAYGKVQLREGPDGTRFAGKLPTVEGTANRRGVARHRPTALYGIEQIVCQGQPMLDLKNRLVRIAERSSTVLLIGESGTGKELFAHAIHSQSRRKDGPFVRVNCAAIPESLLEAELFGYVEGAFSGARRGGQIGKFEQAHGGTLLLDEISEMPLSMQAKLLRVLQEREISPLGSQEVRSVDVRFVAATNCDAQALVKEGKLRSDLYYRINVVAIVVPPLRERPEDIFCLARHFINQFNAEFELNVQGLSSRAWAALRAYPFPGNVRELRSAIESAFNMVNGPFIRLYDLPPQLADHSPGEVAAAGSARGGQPMISGAVDRRPLQEIIEGIEKELIVGAMEKVGGNKLAAASLLGISRPGLYKKLQKYHLF